MDVAKDAAWGKYLNSCMDKPFSSKETFFMGWDAAIKSLAIPQETIPYHEIISYLNEMTGKSFKLVTPTKNIIKARWNEGFRLDDFKHVIKTKTDQWVRDKDMCIYLRPHTIFGNKFDSYLNETPKVRAALEEWQ